MARTQARQFNNAVLLEQVKVTTLKHTVHFNGKRVEQVNIPFAHDDMEEKVNVTFKGRKYADSFSREEFVAQVGPQLLAMTPTRMKELEDEFTQRELESNVYMMDAAERHVIGYIDGAIQRLEQAIVAIKREREAILSGYIRRDSDVEIIGEMLGVAGHSNIQYLSREWREFKEAVKVVERENSCKLPEDES